MVCFVVCFGAPHGTIYYSKHAVALDVAFRKYCRMTVGDPSNIDLSLQWHKILHDWSIKGQMFIEAANVHSLSHRTNQQDWHVACHVVPHCWIRPCLCWNRSDLLYVGILLVLDFYVVCGKCPTAIDGKLVAVCRQESQVHWWRWHENNVRDGNDQHLKIIFLARNLNLLKYARHISASIVSLSFASALCEPTL